MDDHLLAGLIDPRPIFGDPNSMTADLESFHETHPDVPLYLACFPVSANVEFDHSWARRFLAGYVLHQGSFGNYRGFIERLLLWSWIYKERSVVTLSPLDFDEFICFVRSPPASWVGASTRPRFKMLNGKMRHNPAWRPMDVRSTRSGRADDLSAAGARSSCVGTIRFMVSVCNSFYRMLYEHGVTSGNPTLSFNAKLKRVSKIGAPSRAYLDSNQWEWVIKVAEDTAKHDDSGVRELFILSATYHLLMHISDLSNDSGSQPLMSDFFSDELGCWWFSIDTTTPPRRMRVPADLLSVLTRYRKTRGLVPLPSPDEGEPLLETLGGRPGLGSRQIRNIVKKAFENAIESMREAGKPEDECLSLTLASHRWLRDAGAKAIAEDRVPSQLRRELGLTSTAYTYSRYYPEKA